MFWPQISTRLDKSHQGFIKLANSVLLLSCSFAGFCVIIKRHTHFFFVKITQWPFRKRYKSKKAKELEVYLQSVVVESLFVFPSVFYGSKRDRSGQVRLQTQFFFSVWTLSIFCFLQVFIRPVSSLPHLFRLRSSKWAEWGFWMDLRRGNFINVQFMWSYYFVQIKQLAKPVRLFQGDF